MRDVSNLRLRSQVDQTALATCRIPGVPFDIWVEPRPRRPSWPDDPAQNPNLYGDNPMRLDFGPSLTPELREAEERLRARAGARR